MSSAAEILSDIPTGLHYRPDDDELVGLYLLSRVRGQPDPVPGLIVEDDTAANTQPWKLFQRHGRPDNAPAFFYVHDAKGGARPDRRCHGGGTWKSQKCVREDGSHEMVLDDGEKIKWKRHNLNLHMGSGKNSGGSVGWVMHELSIIDHPSSIKICEISFSGYGHQRKRIPDDDCHVADEPESQRPRVDAASSWTTTTTSSQETEHVLGPMEQGQLQEQLDIEDCHGASVAAAAGALGTPTLDQAYSGAVHVSANQGSSDEFIAQMIQEMTDPAPVMELQVADNGGDMDGVPWGGYFFC